MLSYTEQTINRFLLQVDAFFSEAGAAIMFRVQCSSW